MRHPYSDVVERGRLREDGNEYSTRPGERCGMFLLRHPRSRIRLRVMVGTGGGWEHVSVSAKGRCPTWDEMDWVRRLFWSPDETVMQLHVPFNEHVNVHPHVLHLWRPIGVEIPRPPSWMV